jgi:hypothetical protein
MKKLAMVFAIVALTGLSAAVACDKQQQASKNLVAGAETQAKQVTLTGFLTDSYCGAANANTTAKSKQCALSCIKKGAMVQLYANETLYTLDAVDAPDGKVGHKVTVTGMLNEADNTIKVATIERVKKG